MAPAAVTRRSASRVSALAVLLVVGILALVSRNDAFTSAVAARGASKVARSAYESGKINLGVSTDPDSKVVYSPPPLEVNDATRLAIYDCVEEGCSVDALMSLDSKLARDEERILGTMSEVKENQKTQYSKDADEMLSWLENFLSRSSALRAQLQALKGAGDNDFVKQMVKAAAVAFGGARKGDYPAVGVSSYTA